ncbi:MAG: HAD-IA family hydrolase [Chloroflexi bacterium]|nr:HAD-IA family hydrolase [Chloroflexota bacterium]
MIEALIFDFDGLIVDTEMPEFIAWQEIYHAHGAELILADWAVSIGTAPEAFDACAHLEAQIGRAVDHAHLNRACKARHIALAAREAPRPGIADYLSEARRLGLKVGLASSSSRRWLVDHLARLSLLDAFDCISCADDVAQVKPDPAVYTGALETLGVAAHSALAFEDSPNGIHAAQAAGIFCVAVPNDLTRHLDLSHADLQLDSLAGWPLVELLAEVERRRM